MAGSSDEMVTMMKGGSFDLVTASSDASLRMVAVTTLPILGAYYLTREGQEVAGGGR